MNLKSFKCKKCGMIFLNSRELDVHEINVHIDKLYQCKSCYKILWNADEFNDQAPEIVNKEEEDVNSNLDIMSQCN